MSDDNFADPMDEDGDDDWDDDGGGDNEEEWGDAPTGDDGWVPGPAISSAMEEAPALLSRQFSVKSLAPMDIDAAVEKQVAALHEELEIPPPTCLLLLRRFKWNLQKVVDVYFTDTDKILADCGVCLNPKQPKQKDGEIECRVCMDDVSVDEVFCLQCAHQTTCINCWKDYLLDGTRTKECVSLTCPEFKCEVVIPSPVWKQILEPSEPEPYKRYQRFTRENFVECSKEFAFCPGRNCEMIYSSQAGVAKEVHCEKCTYRFCWACKQETHFPGSCHVAEKWNQKNSSEAENLSWILAKTKRCPKCSVHIEKNQGCNHMTCRKGVGGCGYEFCWLCKGDWSAHGSGTGGYYNCNIFEKNKAEGKISEEQEAQENAKNELERYEFHWTRFDSHIKSATHVTKQKVSTEEKMHELASTFNWRLNEAQFLLEAVIEATHCFHVLAWTYPIAYFFDPKQNVGLFKEQQGTLEKFCNGLQEKLDFELEKLGDNKTRQEIIHYTITARQYRQNLVRYIEEEISF